MKIGLIGCGHMGGAIAKALIAKKIGEVFISNPMKPHINAKWTANNCKAAQNADIVLIAVRPDTVRDILKEIKPALKPKQILISIAAGIPLKQLRKWSGGHKKIVRVMPNLAVQIFEGISVWKSSGLSKREKSTVEKLLNSFGANIEANNENLINMATAIGGGGPAYTAAFLETMSRSAQEIGFSAADARKLALQSVYGSVIYMQQTGLDFAEVKQAVQTKGGTTEAGFKILKKKNWQKILEKALLTGYKRAKGLSS